MAGLTNKIKRIEERMGMRQKPDMGIPIIFSYPARPLFLNDDEQRSYMDWRLQQVRAEYAREQNFLPIPIMMLVDEDDIREHLAAFRREQEGEQQTNTHAIPGRETIE